MADATTTKPLAAESPPGEIAVHLDSRQRKFRFLLSTTAIALISLVLAARSAVANKLGSSTDDVAALRSAADLEPGNAARHYWLGRVAIFVQQDSATAVRELEETTRLNPWVVNYWLDLALAYKSIGDAAGESRALEQALQAEPKNLDAALSEGSFFLSRGETALAMQRFRLVLANDPADPLSVLDTCWRATHDVHAVLEALPPRASLHFRLLDLMVHYGEPEAAGQVWDRLITLQHAFDSGKPVAYVDWLVQVKQPAAARKAWDQIQQIQLKSAKSGADDLLVNPGFEDELQNDGFDWRFGNGGAVTFDQDEEQAHSGKRSLAITYTGASISDAGLLQFFPAEPGTSLRLTAFARSKDLLASERPRLGIEDFYSRAVIATGSPIPDSAAWQPTSVDFVVPADSHLLAIKILQGPTASRIKGTLWVDDFKLSATGSTPTPTAP
jgi:tetratricopeptide (TPR) repeat protein